MQRRRRPKQQPDVGTDNARKNEKCRRKPAQRGERDQGPRLAVFLVVTGLDWTNPHARLYLDVKEDSGKVTPWEFELGSPNGLRRAGWTRNSLKKGDEVTVRAFPEKDGSHLANAFSIETADGKSVLSGVSSGRYPSTR